MKQGHNSPPPAIGNVPPPMMQAAMFALRFAGMGCMGLVVVAGFLLVVIAHFAVKYW